MADATLGAHMSDTLIRLTGLIVGTADDGDREQLTRQHKRLAMQLQTLVDETVDAQPEEYKEATAALATAIEALKAAKKEADAVARAIKRVAQAISAVAKLAQAVA
jgi:hypothetical protein